MALRKRRKNAKSITHSFVWRKCDKCHREKTNYKTRDDVIEYICGDCFAIEIYKEECKIQVIEDKKPKYARGWNLAEYYKAPDGKKFSYGKEVKRKPRKTKEKIK